MKTVLKNQMWKSLVVLMGAAAYACADAYDEWEANYPIHAAAGTIIMGDNPAEEKKIRKKVLQTIRSAKNVNVLTDFGQSPLHSCRFDVQIASALLEKGVEVNTRDRWGQTALHLVSERGVDELMELYIRAGARVGHRNIYGANVRDIVMGACVEGDDEYRKQMDKLLALSEKDADYTALHAAAEKGNEKEVARLLASGAEADAVDMYSETPLHKAAAAASRAAADILIQNGASVKAEDIDGRTPLHLAARTDQKTTELLVKRGADVAAKDAFGMSPLHLAAANDNVNTVHLLVQAGAKVNDVNKRGYTPLHVAAMNCRESAVAKLLELGADKTLRNADGETAYMLIPGNCDSPELQELLSCEED